MAEGVSGSSGSSDGQGVVRRWSYEGSAGIGEIVGPHQNEHGADYTHLSARFGPQLFFNSNLQLGIFGYGMHSAGNLHTNGSRRTLAGVEAEPHLRLTVIPFLRFIPFLDHLFLSANAGAGLGASELNFGGGANPVGGFDAFLHAGAGIGFDWRFQNRLGLEFGVRKIVGWSPVRAYTGDALLVSFAVTFGPPVDYPEAPHGSCAFNLNLHLPSCNEFGGGEDPSCQGELEKAKKEFHACQDEISTLRTELQAAHGRVEAYFELNAGMNDKLKEVLANPEVQAANKICGPHGITAMDLKNIAIDLPQLPQAPEATVCREALPLYKAAIKSCKDDSPGSLRAQIAQKIKETKTTENTIRPLSSVLGSKTNHLWNWAMDCYSKLLTPPPPVCPGCPKCPDCPPPPPPRITVRTPSSVFLFANNSADLGLQQQKYPGIPNGAKAVSANLDDWIIFLNKLENKTLGVRIHGYANDTGKSEDNQTLSEKRARAVANYLMGVGRPKNTYVPAGEYVKAEGCIAGNNGDTDYVIHCPVKLSSDRVKVVQGNISDPKLLDPFKDELKKVGIKNATNVLDNSDPIFRSVWIELSDKEGRFHD
jgi:hypothetical protein